MSIFDRMSQQGTMQGQLQQLKQNPAAMLKQAGLNIPDNLAGNPQAMVMHLIQTGQVGGPALQRVMPMIRKMGGQ